MSKVLVTDTYLKNIGNSIRTKNGTETTYKPSEMAAAIADLPEPSGSIEISENGTFNVTDYASAVVNVSGGASDDMIIYLSQYTDVDYKLPVSVPRNKTWEEICETINDFYIKQTNKIWSYFGGAQMYYDAEGENPILKTDTPVEGTQYFCN